MLLRCTIAGACGLSALAASVCPGQWSAISLHDPAYDWSRVNAVTPAHQYGRIATQGPVAWSGSAAGWQHMPGPPSFGEVFGARGDYQVGTSSVGATLWTPGGAISLHPPATIGSFAYAVADNQQVGDASIAVSVTHAALWTGSSGSFVDLHPVGASDSFARATDGILQGGWALTAAGNRAALWAGTAASYSSLHPTGGLSSAVFGMVPGQQVGRVSYIGVGDHAALWRGTAASYVDLNPPGAGLSVLNATCGVAQVGYANLGGVNGAGVWFGTPESFLSIHQYLPPGYFSSVATSVVVENGTLYVGGYARNSASQQEAFLWTGPVPAPGAIVPLGAGAIYLARRRR